VEARVNLREIDAKVAEHVMGLRDLDGSLIQDKWNFSRFPAKRIRALPNYSTDACLALEVAEKLKFINVKNCNTDEMMEMPFTLRRSADNKNWEAGWERNYYELSEFVEAESPALAICLAALKAKGIEV
jgi:hypothetical protein